MLPNARSPLGAPGVFVLPDRRPPALHPQRMDVCAFVGVAPRGPALLPEDEQGLIRDHRLVTESAIGLRRSSAVPVSSFDEYRLHFGGFEGPGALPHAVASYFEQGGRLAWIVRIVHADTTATLATGRASGKLEAGKPFTVETGFLARNPGAWGNRLTVVVGFSTTPVNFSQDGTELRVDQRSPIAQGCLLRFLDGAGNLSLSFCDGIVSPEFATPPAGQAIARRPASYRVLQLSMPAPANTKRMDLVQAWIEINDGDGRSERFEHLALDPDHPRGISNVLCDEAALVWPDPAWADQRLLPADARVERINGRSSAFVSAVADEDAYADIVAADFFDPYWSPAEEMPGEGIACLAGLQQVTQLVVPDLYVPAQWVRETAEGEPASGGAGAEFSACVDVVAAADDIDNVPPLALTGLILDPRTHSGLDVIATLQQQVVDFCEDTQSLIALLDVPPDLSQADIESWRARFDSSWAAAYHPWLHPARRGDNTLLWPRPPSAVAAGIIARRELERGIQYGPANEIANRIVSLAERQPVDRADTLHPHNINCFVRAQEGIRLIAARTLSYERDWRQLSVRRLILMLRRTLLVEMQWAVFEPNGPTLWNDLKHAIESLLRGLFRVGAFAGRNEAESYFVRVNAESWRQDRGELLVEIGVAPTEPLEFILLRLSRNGDGTLNLEE